ncbi:uncharacterized protein BX664DRAFT_337351 [Halteromyces radiatus]|uniref:uncharacterized protein n=1 Tax=Halteromyces radiatus TaxID=101107 RepID=UPI00222028EB|nr:uncharacterized protein BX664DRAFT_337351 [Halteromyces radiatus]KAI8084596.1 hypothetical protein BX664DRAFT_337351 [Halteromyces radiatus]
MAPSDVRKLFKQEKSQRQSSKKIEHVFAKYDTQGRLGCVLCHSIVKSEQLWGPHLQSARHKELLAQLKAIKQQQQQKQHIAGKKRSVTETGGDAALLSKRARFEQLEKEMEEEQEEEESDDSMDDSDQEMEQQDDEDNTTGLPADFFDTPSKTVASQKTTMKAGVHRDLPSGFFDDANEEAKARQVDAPDALENQQLEEEYAAFKEMMVDTNEETDKMQEQDEETMLLERDIELARQQLALDEKVQQLKQQRQQGRPPQQQKTTIDDVDKDLIRGKGWTVGLKSSVRQFMKQSSRKQAQPIFDDEDEEEDDESDWRAQHV